MTRKNRELSLYFFMARDAEICNAELVRKASGYYFHIVTFVPKKVKVTNGQQVGIDFGIKTNLDCEARRFYPLG